jgi:hypothetical protein
MVLQVLSIMFLDFNLSFDIRVEFGETRWGHCSLLTLTTIELGNLKTATLAQLPAPGLVFLTVTDI